MLGNLLSISDDFEMSAVREVFVQISNLKLSFNRSHFFSVESNSEKCWLEWVHLMCVCLQSRRVLSIEDLTEILNKSIDVDSRDMLSVVCTTLPCRWLTKIILCIIARGIRNQKSQCSLDEMRKLEDAMICLPSNCNTLLGILADKLKCEGLVVDNKSTTVTVSMISNIFGNIASLSTIDCHKLLSQPLWQWPRILREQQLSINWPKEMLPFILKLEDTLGEKRVENFLKTFSNQFGFNHDLLGQISILFTNNPWTMNVDVLEDLTNAEMKTAEQWISSLKYHCENFKPGAYDINELTDILRGDKCNKSISDLLGTASDCLMIEYIERIHEFTGNIRNWKKSDVTKWNEEHRKNGCGIIGHDGMSDRCLEAIAVVCQAIKLLTTNKNTDIRSGGFYPRDTQLLALLIFLNAVQAKKGCLGEISTGEGKTLTIAMFVILKVLDGDCVDVISSSSVLAAENSIEMKKLFGLFGISVDNNFDEACEKDEDLRRERYKSDVIYGDLGSFQRDILLSEFFEKGITRNRKPNCIVVDEVDSMLLDKSINVLYLSHDIPDFEYFNIVFFEIWQAVHAPDVYRGSEADIAIVVKYVKERVKVGAIEIPNCFKPILERHLVLWVKNAFVAKNCVRANDSYILADVTGKGMQVVVMDKDTGVEQTQMQWSHGLHQFLKLKHGDNLHSESLKAVFMSNLGYFKRFPGNIFGVSGTLGSVAEMKLLKEVYKLETFKMSRFKPRYCANKDAYIAESESKWIDYIADSVKKETNDGRSVLVICENIKYVDAITNELAKRFKKPSIYSYKSAFDKEFHRRNSKRPLTAGDIIVATNLAGRGTDLKINDAVDEKGGLHVILTFLPANKRTEMQAEGRTARAGLKGTFQFIIMGDDSISIDELRKNRDENECRRLEESRLTSFQRLNVEERLFKKFEKFYGSVKDKLKKQNENKLPYENLQMEFLLNHWAVWLDEVDEQLDKVQLSGEQTLLKRFEEFKNKISQKIEIPCKIKLAEFPSELNKLGKYFESEQQLSLAIQCFTRSIDISPHHSEVAYYYRAACYLRQSCELKAELLAVADLKKAKYILHKKISTLTTTNQILQLTNNCRKESGETVFHSRYEKQVKNGCQLNQVHIDAIEKAVGKALTVEYFESLANISETEEAQQLFDAIRVESKLCKNFRLNKKLKITAEGLLTLKNGEQPIKIPAMFSCCKDAIINFIRKKLSGNLRIDDMDFEGIVISRSEIWDQMRNSGFIEHEVVERIKTITFDEVRFAGLTLPEEFASLKSPLQKILSEQHTLKYDPERILSDLDLNVGLKTGLLEFLMNHNFVCDILCASGKLSGKFSTEEEQLALPKELVCYEEIIKELIRSKDNETRVSRESITYFDCTGTASKQLWLWMKDAGVIKDCKVNLTFKHTRITLEKWLAEAKQVLENSKRVRKIYNEFHGSVGNDSDHSYSFKDYISTIVEGLKTSAGEITILPSIQVDYVKIEEYFLSADEYPSEIDSFEAAAFADVLSLTEHTSRWSWGAFAIAMIGLAQIVAAIGLAVISGGALLNVSMTLINEGVGDMIFAMQAGLTKSFSWKDYGIHKRISLTVPLLTFGIGAVLSKAYAVETAVRTSLQIFKVCATTAVKQFASSAAFMFLDQGIEFLLDKMRTCLVGKFSEHIKSAVAKIFQTKLERIRELMQNLLHSHPKSATKRVKDAFDNAMRKVHEYTLKTKLATEAIDKAKSIIGGCLGIYSDAMISKAQTMQASGSDFAAKAARVAKLTKYVMYAASTTKYISRATQMAEFSNEYFDLIISMLNQQQRNHSTNETDGDERLDEETKQRFENQSEECLEAAEKFIGEHICKELQNGFVQPAVQALAHKGMKKIGNAMLKCTRTMIKNMGFECGKTKLSTYSDTEHTNQGGNVVELDAPVANGDGLPVRHFLNCYEDIVNFYKDTNGQIYVERPDYDTFAKTIGKGKKAGQLEIMTCANVFDRPILVVDKTPDRSFTSNIDKAEVLFNPRGVVSNKEPLVIEYTLNAFGQGHFTAVVNGERQTVGAAGSSTSSPNCCLYKALECHMPGMSHEDIATKVRKYAKSSTTFRYLFENRIQECSIGLWGGTEDLTMSTSKLHREVKSGRIKLSQESLSWKTKIDNKDATIGNLRDNIRDKGWQGDPIRLIKLKDGTLMTYDHRRLVAAASLNSNAHYVKFIIHRLDENLVNMKYPITAQKAWEKNRDPALKAERCSSTESSSRFEK